MTKAMIMMVVSAAAGTGGLVCGGWALQSILLTGVASVQGLLRDEGCSLIMVGGASSLSAEGSADLGVCGCLLEQMARSFLQVMHAL